MKTYVFIKIFLQKYVSNAFIDKNILNGRKLNQAIPVCDFYKFRAINYRGIIWILKTCLLQTN